MTAWNFADIYEIVAEKVPDSTCQVHGDRRYTWQQFDRRSNALAADLIASGLGRQSKVAAYLYNGPEYLETYIAAFKGGMAPVNTNYRYGPDEIVYLFDNADAEAVVFHATFTELIEKVRDRLPMVRRWYVVTDGGPEPDWATPYEEVVGTGADRAAAPWGRSPDDLLLLYTGGTTGMPKGVMWRQDDLFNVLGAGGNALIGEVPRTDIEDFKARLTGPGLTMLPACPLMHGTGQFSALIAFNLGGCVVTMPERHFDAAELWRTVEREGVNSIVIVGDAFAKPMLSVLEEKPGRFDLSSLMLVSSSGVMWSHDVKEGMLGHLPPGAILFDSFGSSEAVGLGASVSTAGSAQETAKFLLGERVKVFTDEGKPVEPGSEDVGFVAIAGNLPVGYYKDAEKTARTFREIDGARYSVPGDYAKVNPDGTLTLLGRGSVCINTGGEKVFPEEVEEILKLHPGVRDAVCVGIPDDRFGETVCAVVETEPGVTLDPDDVIAYTKSRLASYKAPRRVFPVDTIGRSPSGKVDYQQMRSLAQERAGV